MAIQITPQKETAINKTLWVTILFYFSIILFIASVVSYFVFDHFVVQHSKTLIGIGMDIEQAGTKEEKIKEKELLKTQGHIKNFSKLLDDHKFVSIFFAEFEQWCHPQVWFSSINLNINDFSADLVGQTDNFQTLGQQMLFLKNHELIKNTSLSNIQMGESGKIGFNLSISFSPQVFKPEE